MLLRKGPFVKQDPSRSTWPHKRPTRRCAFARAHFRPEIPYFSCLRIAIPISRNCRSGTVDGASAIRSVPRAVLGKGITSRIDVSPARIITSRSSLSAIPPCGGAPYSRAVPKPAARFVFGESQRGEHLRLHIATMNTNRARAHLHAIQHQIVRFGAAACRVGGQLLQILVVHRREGVMRGGPAVFFLVPFEHGEVHHPQELQVLGVEQLMAVVELLRGVQAQMAAGLVDGLFGTLSLGLAGLAPFSLTSDGGSGTVGFWKGT